MTETTSPTTGRRYGVAQACRVWAVPRSSFCATQRAEAESAAPLMCPVRRGPQPAVSDEALLAAIRADLERSPWAGEGHRKVLCGRLRNANAYLTPLTSSASALLDAEPARAGPGQAPSQANRRFAPGV